MAKIVYNNYCGGDFELSHEAVARYAELKGMEPGTPDRRDIEKVRRDDPALVQVVEELGERANGRYANLEIMNVPDGTRYRIDDSSGSERVMTIDDYGWSIAGKSG